MRLDVLGVSHLAFASRPVDDRAGMSRIVEKRCSMHAWEWSTAGVPRECAMIVVAASSSHRAPIQFGSKQGRNRIEVAAIRDSRALAS